MARCLYVIFTFAAILATIAVCFPHNYAEKQSSELTAHKKTYQPLITQRDSTYFAIKKQLVTGEITIAEYDKIFDAAYYGYKADNKAYNKTKKEIQKSDSVIGYTSFKNFLLGTGFLLSLFITTLILFHSKIKELDHNKRVFHLLGYGAMVLNSSYWIVWSFLFNVNSHGKYDFENWQYNTMLYVLPVFVAVGSFFLFKHQKTLEDKLAKMIGVFFRSYYEDLEKEGLVHPEKDKDFRRFRVKLTDEVTSYE